MVTFIVKESGGMERVGLLVLFKAYPQDKDIM
jgi:hypothetical protein